MKTLDMHNLEESSSTHEQMYRHFQLFHKMHNQLPMGYPTEFVAIGDRAHLVKDRLLQFRDIGAVKFTDKLNELDNSDKVIYYIRKNDNQKDKIGYTTDIIEATNVGNLIISKDRLDKILLQYCMFKWISTHPDLKLILTLYKSKDPHKYYGYKDDIHLISNYNNSDIDLNHMTLLFQKFEAVVPELENFVKYTNEVYQISREIDDSPKKLSEIKSIIGAFKIEISPAAYEFLKLEFSRGRIQIVNIKDNEYSIHIDSHRVYYSKLIALLNLTWQKGSNMTSKRKLIELIKSDQCNDLIIPADLIDSVICILQDRTKI